jgi:hypothetical protein
VVRCNSALATVEPQSTATSHASRQHRAHRVATRRIPHVLARCLRKFRRSSNDVAHRRWVEIVLQVLVTIVTPQQNRDSFVAVFLM